MSGKNKLQIRTKFSPTSLPQNLTNINLRAKVGLNLFNDMVFELVYVGYAKLFF